MLVFNDKEHRTEATRGAMFWGEAGDKRVFCLISREALDDHYSDGDRLKPDAAFLAHREEIEEFARRKFARGQLEPDGSILIRTGDFA